MERLLYVDDSRHPDDYAGPYLLSDPDAEGEAPSTPAANRPFAYAPCQRITLRGLITASGKNPLVSPNEELASRVVVQTS